MTYRKREIESGWNRSGRRSPGRPVPGTPRKHGAAMGYPLPLILISVCAMILIAMIWNVVDIHI